MTAVGATVKLSLAFVASTLILLASLQAADRPARLRVLTWNIWNGGDEAKSEKDPAVKARKQQSIADVIKASEADVVAMVGTYGSGEVIAKALGYHFQPRGTNVSILSRWPISQDISVYKPFHCVGSLIERPDGRRFALYSVWIHYKDDIWTDPRSRDGRSAADLIAKDGESRLVEFREIARGIEHATASFKDVPIVLAGDFNSNSHLDYTEKARDQYGPVVDWPLTRAVVGAGYRDAYRECNPVVDRKKDRTWSPKFPKQIQDRIDYIFWKGEVISARSARMIDQHKPHWPSDHAAVLAEFDWK